MARWPCFICGEETHDNEHVEVRGYRRGSNPWTCAKHVAELIDRWHYFFPATGLSHTEGGGLELAWDELKRIEDRFQRDVVMRSNVYTITDRESRSQSFGPSQENVIST